MRRHCCSNLFFILVIPAKNIDGGGWTLVRHVPAGNVWHKATDQLRGTDVYGTPCGSMCKQEWSIRFDNKNFNQFLFATGDESKWLIADKDVVTGGYYANDPRLIYKSSTNANSYSARWYRRSGNKEDPWISLTDHHPAIGQGNILYGENHFGSTHANKILPQHKGANVFVRMHGMIFLFHVYFYVGCKLVQPSGGLNLFCISLVAS